MNDLASPSMHVALLVVVVIFGCASLAVWTGIVLRISHGEPVIRRQWRRPVPWTALEVVLIFAVYFTVASGAQRLLLTRLAHTAIEPATAGGPTPASAEHAIARLLSQGSPALLVLCAIAAAVVAPIVEEFLFRLVLQGWLEALLFRQRRRFPSLRRLLPGGTGPILLVAFLFALAHFRVSEAPRPWQFYAAGVVGAGLGGIAAVAAAITLLRLFHRARLSDFGVVPAKIAPDVMLGLLAFAALAVPIYAVQLEVSQIVPKWLAPDPAAIFVLALGLGFLYYRTHRIVPSIVTHAALNITSLLAALLMLAR